MSHPRLPDWTAARRVAGRRRTARRCAAAGALVIVKAANAESLPTKADGSVDEGRLDRVKVGELADIASGTSRHKVLDLAPGSYVAFCNIVGGMGMGGGTMGGMNHVHFADGMHTTFTVTA